MTNRVKKALENHRKGYNCAHAVACVFCDEFGKDEKEVFEIMEAFGFGMGTMGTCGAVSAMAAVAGMKESDGNLDKPGTKKASYRAMKEMTGKCMEKNGSVVCREIKGVDTGRVLRSCDGCVTDAVEIIEEYLSGNKEA